MDTRILIVDDDPLICRQLEDLYTSQQYLVSSAGNASEALRLLGEHDFSLAVVDLRIPGTDGIGLTREIREHWPDLDVIMITGYASIKGAVEAMMPMAADHRVQDGERFRFGDYEVVALHTPGHTPGSICLLAGERLFSGDTLFPGGPGNTANPYASFPTIIDSIRDKLFTLPDDIEVLPGHGKPTTIGRERPHLDEWIERG